MNGYRIQYDVTVFNDGLYEITIKAGHEPPFAFNGLRYFTERHMGY